MTLIRKMSPVARVCSLMLMSLASVPSQVCAQSDVSASKAGSEQTWTVNFKETDIQELIRFVATATNRTIIVDDKVRGKVQVISAKPVNSEELYELFLSILEIYGFTAVESGDITRIIPLQAARTAPVQVTTDNEKGESSEIITEVIQLENISAAKLIPVLRPLAPQQAHMAAYAPSNAIIISDTAANINRIKEVIRNIDLSAVQKTELIPLEHASAEEVVRMIQQLQKVEAAQGAAEASKMVLVADKRTNSVLLSAEEMDRLRIMALIKNLDTPLAQNGNVQVIYLEYAEAKALSEVLTRIVQNMEGLTPQAGNNAAARNKGGATIEADEGTNSLIVTAEADVMQSLMSVVKMLDIRRAQVLVEAIIVEMSDDDGRDLGVEWLFVNESGAYGSSTSSGLGGALAAAGFETDDNGDAVDSRPALATVLGNTAGQVLGIGRLQDDISFNVVLNALQTNREANILSTPSLMTLDNEEASITVGENIPFVTGSYTSTGSASSNPDNPFQTVERENVGISLKITPQINEGDSMILAISQEVSNVIEGSAIINSNPVTSERKIDTKVLADDGQIIVLGGLIEDDITEQVQKVPVLGDIPIIGAVFKNTSIRVGKRHLLVFLRPTIVRDKRAMDAATASKYRLIREQQIQEIEEGIDLYNDETLPLLPEWREQLEKLQEMRQEEQQVDETTEGNQR